MEDEINLLDYWRVIVKRKWLIIGLAIITALVALIFTSRQPKLYQATATIMSVDTGGGGLASAMAAVPLFGGGGGGGGGGEGKLIPILKSATLARQVALSLDLQEFFPKFSRELGREVMVQNAAGMFQGAIESKSAEGLLNVTIIWSNPVQAAELSNRYVEELGKFLNMRSLNVNFHVIDPAVAPTGPFNRSKQKIRLNLMIGGVSGLFVGAFIAFFLEYIEKFPRQS